jgi:hypothetical protein
MSLSVTVRGTANTVTGAGGPLTGRRDRSDSHDG